MNLRKMTKRDERIATFYHKCWFNQNDATQEAREKITRASVRQRDSLLQDFESVKPI
jgi:hypothetical protein